MDPIQVRTYRDATAEAAAQRFQADAAEAAKNGYYPASQVWEGSSLTVTYQRREPTTAGSTASQVVASSRPVSIPPIAILIGGILVAVGSLLPWVRVGIVSAGGMEGDGIFTMVLAVGLMLIGVAGATDAARASSLSLLAGLASVLALALAGFHIIDIGGQTGIQRQVGEGLYLISIGGVVALAGAIRSRSKPIDIKGQIPNLRQDIKALPQVFKKPLVWAPFGLLLLAFGLELARQAGAFPEGQVADIATLYIQLTLPPTSLFVFFIGGLVASRASYLVGALLGIFDAFLITILVFRDEAALEGAGIAEVAGQQSTLEALVPLWSIAILIGALVAGFAGWIASSIRKRRGRM